MAAGNKTKGRKDELSFRLITLSFSLIAILLFSVVSAVSMNVQGQNSTSMNNSTSTSSNPSEETEPSSSNSTSTISEASDASSGGNSTSSNQSSNQTGTTSPEEGQEQSQNTTSSEPTGNVTSTSEDSQNANGTSTSQTQQETSQNVTSTESSAMNQTGQNENIQNATETSITQINISGEPLLVSLEPIVRKYSFPVLKFDDEVAAEVAVTIKWSLDGTTEISDSRGYGYTLKIPNAENTTMALFQNSTVVDQKVTGIGLHYDIYWFALKNSEGIIDRYEFIIAGSSENSSIVSLDIGSISQLKQENHSLMVTRPNIDKESDYIKVENWDIPQSENDDETDPAMTEEIIEGLSLDWSDAIGQGYDMRFDAEKSSLEVNVNGTFVIDPTVVSTVNNNISPSSTSSLTGQQRLVTAFHGDTTTLFAFYYNGSSIVYKTSVDEGEAWSSSTYSVVTGSLGESVGRWSLVTTNYNGSDFETSTQFIHVFYWNLNATNDMLFYTKRGEVNGASITWRSAVALGSVESDPTCICPSVSPAVDMRGTLYVAISWESTDDYIIKKSINGGSTWSNSLTTVDETSNMSINLMPLDSEGLILVYAKYGTSSLYYRVFNGTTWGSKQTLSGVGLTTNTVKQLSSANDDSYGVFVAFTNVTGSTSGILKIATFLGNGTFVSTETADSTLRHRLPNIIFSSSGDLNINSIANSKVYNTRKSLGGWAAPFNPYGTSFSSLDQLTATTVWEGENGALWREGSSAPYNIKFGMLEHGLVEPSTTIQNSPSYADYFEGERRVVGNSNGTLFAFYYDGSNIRYKRSLDSGHTWSGSSTSTGTGVIASDNFRWTIAHSSYNGTNRIVLLYYVVSGSNTNFYAKAFEALDSGLVSVSTVNLFSVANDASCSPTGVCASAAGASSSTGILYAAFSYKTAGAWNWNMKKSSDGGSTWSSANGPVPVSGTSNHVSLTITPLDNGKMILAWARYDSSSLYYRVYNNTCWCSTITQSNIGWSSNTVKQISSGTVDQGYVNGSVTAYIAFLSSGNQGTLKAAIFSGSGKFQGIETVDGTITHWLPSISVSNDRTVHIYTLYNNTVYDTKKVEIPILNWGFEHVNFGIDHQAAAYWQFENDTLDYSGNDNNAVAYGNSTITDEIVGLVGTSIDFDGVNDYLRIPDTSSLDISSNITISAWLRIDAQSNDTRTILRKEGAYLLEKDSNNHVRFTIWSGGSSPAVTGTTTLQINKWYHIIGTYDGSNLRVYVNNVLEATQARTGLISTSSNALFIGATNGTSQFINAKLDEVLIYNKTLNQEEMVLTGTGWDLRGASIETVGPMTGEISLLRPGVGDSRSMAISASPGKLYTLQADVLVNSGFAKIELDFMNSTGFWLTNNTLPSSGTSVTTTSGAIQHLSASWIAPSNTASMIIRLLNNGSGGSAAFDVLRLTTWEVPEAPYGTDLYYPDQLTSMIGSPFSTGVLWRGGSSTPYEIRYGGQLGGTLGTSTFINSPGTSSTYNGQKRVVRTSSGGFFGFYYNGANIMYKYSMDAYAWQTAKSAGTGPLYNDNFRWSVVTSKLTSDYIILVYYIETANGVDFMAKRARVSDSILYWSPAWKLKSVTSPDGCGSDACSVIAGRATNNYIYAAIAWRAAGNPVEIKYQIYRSTNAGFTFTTSLSSDEFDTSDSRVAMTLTPLTSGGMLFAYLRYDDSDLFYRVLTGTSWGSVQEITSGSGLSVGQIRQMSAISDTSFKAYLAYTTSSSGKLMVASWSNMGNFLNFKTVDETKKHSLPSMVALPDKDIAIYTVSSTRLYMSYLTDSPKGRYWMPPNEIYGRVTPSIKQLTSHISLVSGYAGAQWTGGPLGSYTMKTGGFWTFGDEIYLTICTFLAKPSRVCSSEPNGEFYYETPTTDPNTGSYSYWSPYICGSHTGWCVDYWYYLEFPAAKTFHLAGLPTELDFDAGMHVLFDSDHGVGLTMKKWVIDPEQPNVKFFDFPVAALGWVEYGDALLYTDGLQARLVILSVYLSAGYANTA